MDELEVYQFFESKQQVDNDLFFSMLFNANRLSIIETLLLNTTHELNNKLSIIQLETELFDNEVLNNNINRMTEIIRSIQKYISQAKCDTLYQMNDGIKECLCVCQHLLDKRVKVKYDLFPSLKPLLVNPTLIKQAMINIIFNCVEINECSDV